MARGLGQHIGRTRIAAFAVVAVLAGAATAACGPIVFVGLVVPHVARFICGPDYRWILPYSMLLARSCCCSPTCSAGSRQARRGAGRRGPRRARGAVLRGDRALRPDVGGMTATDLGAASGDTAARALTRRRVCRRRRRSGVCRVRAVRAHHDGGQLPASARRRGRLPAAAPRRQAASTSSCWTSGCRQAAAALAVGLALGVSGTIFQQLLRNPLGLARLRRRLLRRQPRRRGRHRRPRRRRARHLGAGHGGRAGRRRADVRPRVGATA